MPLVAHLRTATCTLPRAVPRTSAFSRQKRAGSPLAILRAMNLPRLAFVSAIVLGSTQAYADPVAPGVFSVPEPIKVLRDRGAMNTGIVMTSLGGAAFVESMAIAADSTCSRVEWISDCSSHQSADPVGTVLLVSGVVLSAIGLPLRAVRGARRSDQPGQAAFCFAPHLGGPTRRKWLDVEVLTHGSGLRSQPTRWGLLRTASARAASRSLRAPAVGIRSRSASGTISCSTSWG